MTLSNLLWAKTLVGVDYLYSVYYMYVAVQYSAVVCDMFLALLILPIDL